MAMPDMYQQREQRRDKRDKSSKKRKKKDKDRRRDRKNSVETSPNNRGGETSKFNETYQQETPKEIRTYQESENIVAGEVEMIALTPIEQVPEMPSDM